MALPSHHLSIEARTPNILTEGKKFDVKYVVKNIGNAVYPGGIVAVRIGWPLLTGIIVNIPVVIPDPLQPLEELDFKMKETPLATGYTMFTVGGATANDERPVEVYLTDGQRLLWPPPQAGVFQLFHAVRAMSHEEINQRNALWAAIIAILITAGWSIIDLLFRYFWRF